MEIDFRTQDWLDAQTVFDFFRHESDCMDKYGRLLIEPRFVVAIGDDPVSAYYAATIAKQAKRQFGKYPNVFCVGGYGPLSKHLNRLDDGTMVSEGAKLRMTVMRLGNFQTTVLDKSNNISDNIKEIADYLTCRFSSGCPLIFCVTQRLSKLLERTVEFLPQQFPEIGSLNAYYYVPGEDIREVCQMYNGMALADGLPLLSEAAALYDRVGTERYAGRCIADFDRMIPKRVIQAGMRLSEKYPLRVARSPFMAPRQCGKLFFNVLKHRKDVEADYEQKIFDWIARI